MKIISLKCPNCGAPLQYDPSHPAHFCSHCGTQLLYDDESKTLSINYKEEKYVVDKAKIEKEKTDRITIICLIIMIVIFLLYMLRL